MPKIHSVQPTNQPTKRRRKNQNGLTGEKNFEARLDGPQDQERLKQSEALPISTLRQVHSFVFVNILNQAALQQALTS
jgi:hypothetical protein